MELTCPIHRQLEEEQTVSFAQTSLRFKNVVQTHRWASPSNPVDRKRLQNRQRAHRKRKTQEARAANGSITSRIEHAALLVAMSDSGEERCENALALDTGDRPNSTNFIDNSGCNNGQKQRHEFQRITRPTFTRLKQTTDLCHLNAEDLSKTMNEVENWIDETRAHYSPSADHLLMLVKFNVFRGLLSNTSILGFCAQDGMKDEAMSPFSTIGPKTLRHSRSLPAALRPTATQRKVEHHPWIDMLPFPQMRDNLIRAGDSYNEMELCGDLVGFFNSPKARNGMIVWGEPWDPRGWELSEDFLRHWAWTLRGCDALFDATNFWRLQRGETLLSFEELL